MNKTITGGILVGIIVIAVVALFFKNTRPKELHPWKLLPNTPDMVLETNNPGQLYDKLKYGNSIWKSLTETDNFKKLEIEIIRLDSLLSDNKKYHEALFSKPLLTAFYTDSNRIETVFVSAAGFTPDIEKLKLFLSQKTGSSFGIVSRQENGYDLLRMINGKTGFTLSLGFAEGMMIASASESLVVKGLNQYNKQGLQHFTNKDSFRKLKKTAGKKINTHLYIKGGGLKNLLTPFIPQNEQQALNEIGNLLEWTEADMFIKKDELILNGLSTGDVNGKGYLRLLSQIPQNQEYINILPSNTTLFLFQGLSDFNRWKPDTKNENKLLDNKKFTALTGSEIVFVSTARTSQEFNKKSFVVVQFNDIERAGSMLLQSAKQSGKIAVKSYGRYKINKLKKGDFIEKTFGSMYGNITQNYYVILDDYIIFGNNPDELINWLRNYETGKTLDLNENFRTFSRKLTETSNLTMFIKIRDFTGTASRFVNEETARNIRLNINVIKDFDGLLLQMSNQQPFIYTNLFVKQSKTRHEDNLALWKVKLEDDIIGKPYPVKDHTTGRYNIIVFDKSNNVYLISYKGTVLWKKQLKGAPESDVFQVDYYKNGKIQYLFNSAEYIYLIDKNGNFVKHFPIKIKPSATNGLSVFDYNKKKDYRLLLAQSDKRIYNYNLKGQKIKGWNNFKMPDIVVKPVQHLIAGNKDYIIVTDINNNVKIVNRRGTTRINIKGKLNKAGNSGFYVNKTNGKGIFITTDKKGRLVYISSGGLLRYTDFGNFSPNHYFLYDDFDGNRSYDFIYVDGKNLTVFDRFKKVLFSYRFQSDIQIKPAFFNLGRNKKVLGIVSDAERTIYLFDKKGNIIINKGLLGEIPFTVTSLKNDKEINLITGSGNTLFNYKVN
jgi:hypothetical protein